MSEEIMKELPTPEILKAELKRIKVSAYRRTRLNNLLAGIVVAVLVSILVTTMLLPVLRISGDGMNPTLRDGDLVVSTSVAEVSSGDVVAFYYNDKILVKRVIGCPSDWIRIDEEGTVYVNGIVSDESYISEKSLGTVDIEFPFEVPKGRYFVLGDCRSVSADSRNTAVGCVAQEQMIGIVVFRVWPFANFGPLV